MTHKTPNRWWCLCHRERFEVDSSQKSTWHRQSVQMNLYQPIIRSITTGCGATRTVMMEQSTVFDPLLHIIQLYGFIIASCHNEPLTGCNSGDGCCVGVMGEVRLGGPLLCGNGTHALRNTYDVYQKKTLNRYVYDTNTTAKEHRTFPRTLPSVFTR